jgi:hypothetical protein
MRQGGIMPSFTPKVARARTTTAKPASLNALQRLPPHPASNPISATPGANQARGRGDFANIPPQERPPVAPVWEFGKIPLFAPEGPIPSQPLLEWAPESEHRAPRSSGSAIDPPLSAYFERVFGWNFGSVRIHTDGRTARAADALGAAAFTVGAEIGFAAGLYDPESPRGRALLAHELTHVVQNAMAPASRSRVLARQTVEQYETQGLVIEPSKLAQLAGFSYWNQKLQDYGFVYRTDTATDQRIKANPEELDAALSVAWQLRPQPAAIAKPISQDVMITGRARGSPDLAYRITFNPPPAQGKKGIVDAVFLAQGRAAGSVQGASRQAVPAAYAAHDFADEDIEEAQTRPDPQKGDKLGQLIGLDKLPADERASVKYAIYQYFAANKTRNAEVDAIVPIVNSPAAAGALGGKPRRVLYTLRFEATANDVTVQRIGEQGKDVSLAPEGGLARVNGYADRARGLNRAGPAPEELKAWVKHRYMSVSIDANATVEQLETSVTAQVRVGSSDPKWYHGNYGIEVLDLKAAEDWILHDVDSDRRQIVDLKDFNLTTELPFLELVLEQMSDAILKSFAGVRFVRQAVCLKWNPTTKDFDRQPETAGITEPDHRTIRIFDQAFVNRDALFLGGIGSGGRPDVRASAAEPVAHELGHVVSYGPGVEQAFHELEGIKPITRYAQAKPDELFAEAFSLYYNDPEWLKANSPKLYTFFDNLDKSGALQKPPAKTGPALKQPGKPGR